MAGIKSVKILLAVLLLCLAAPCLAGAEDQKAAWSALADKQTYVLGVYDATRAQWLQEPDAILPFFGNHDKAKLIAEAIETVNRMYEAGNGYEILPAAHIIWLFWESSRSTVNPAVAFKTSLDEAVQDYQSYFKAGGR